MTPIRCAIVEGSHRCEAACRIFHGYNLGDPIPLVHKNIDIPTTSTLYRRTNTIVYNRKDENMQLNNTVLNCLKTISAKVADYKEKVVHLTWQYFFTAVLDRINCDTDLSPIIYEKQKDFYEEDVH